MNQYSSFPKSNENVVPYRKNSFKQHPSSTPPLLQKQTKTEVSSLLFPTHTEQVENKTYSITVHRGESLHQKEIESIAQQFREDFGSLRSGGWGEYKKCPCNDCSYKVSIEEYYSVPKETYVPLKELERQLPGTSPLQCKQHQKDLVDYWPLEEKIQELQHKLQKQHSRVALLRNSKNTICGYTIGYATSMEEAWDEEFLKLCGENYSPTQEKFLQGCTQALGSPFTKDTPVWIWNTTGISFPARSKDNSQLLRKSLADAIPEECLEYTSPGDTSLNGNLICNLLPAGMIPICHSPIFPNVVLVLFGKTMKELKNNFNKTGEEFEQQHGDEYRMYKKLKDNNWEPLGTGTFLESYCLQRAKPIL